MPKCLTKDRQNRILAPQRGRFTHYWFYVRDKTLGPVAMRVASFLLYQTTFGAGLGDGHQAKRQPAQCAFAHIRLSRARARRVAFVPNSG